MRRTLRTLGPVLAGGLVGAASYVFGSSDPGLTAAVAGSYAVAAGLAARHPDVVYEEGVAVWAVGRWSGASTAFVLLAAFVGVGWTLPIEPGLRVSLQLLVLGVGWAMWVFGVAYARAKAESDRGQDL